MRSRPTRSAFDTGGVGKVPDWAGPEGTGAAKAEQRGAHITRPTAAAREARQAAAEAQDAAQEAREVAGSVLATAEEAKRAVDELREVCR